MGYYCRECGVGYYPPRHCVSCGGQNSMAGDGPSYREQGYRAGLQRAIEMAERRLAVLQSSHQIGANTATNYGERKATSDLLIELRAELEAGEDV